MPGIRLEAHDAGMTAQAQSLALRRPRSARTWRAWLAAWLGGSVIGIVNGAARELVYADRVGDPTAGQISTGSAAVLFALYFGALDRRWPLPSTRTALQVGAVWIALTTAFEFGFGHYVDGRSWSELAHQHDLADGQLWPLLLLWIGLGPAAARAWRTRR